MVCASCGQQLATGARFCMDCGAPQLFSCPSCQTPISSQARSTAWTAAQRWPEPRRRQRQRRQRRDRSAGWCRCCSPTWSGSRRCPSIAIPRRSVSSSAATSIAAAPLIERYGGTVEKFIGDAVMAVWGTPGRPRGRRRARGAGGAGAHGAVTRWARRSGCPSCGSGPAC